MPERLSNESFESIAIHRSSNTLFGHRQSEPREINVIFSVQNCPVAITYHPEPLIIQLCKGPQAESLRRPFARLALMTARPPLVAIRARKPWVRLRRRLLGWNVCFIGLFYRG